MRPIDKQTAGKVTNEEQANIPAQEQHSQPGIEQQMHPLPDALPEMSAREPRLKGKVAIITGGDSGIGRATALDFVKEGAQVVISYLSEDQDAEETKNMIAALGGKCLLIKGYISNPELCREVAQKTMDEYGKIDILVSNAAVQFVEKDFMNITEEQLQLTFNVNVIAALFITQACLPHMKNGASIIYTSSVTAFRGSEHLIDYAATKAALIGLCRSLASRLVKEGIRVNAVAPGPIWTPLIPATFPKDEVEKFGQDTPMGRCGQPNEVAPAFTFLASDESSYFTGQVLHPNGGEMVS